MPPKKLPAKAIHKAVSQLPLPVLTHTQLAELLDEHRAEWELARTLSVDDFVHRADANGLLRLVQLKSQNYKDLTRYAWGEASPFQIALSVKRGAFLSHGSAAFLHDLGDQLPHTIFINAEQSPKPVRPAMLSQEAINRAFQAQQRTSNLTYLYGEWKIQVIAGKNTGRMEVGKLRGPQGEQLEATKVERTLIDLAVRPVYGGGPRAVLEAFRRARERVSANTLVAVLKRFAYVYPYHQVVGYYMERAGYAKDQVRRLAAMPRDFDFYLTYGMKNPEYIRSWRLFVPKGL